MLKKGTKNDVLAQSSFIANANNELYAFLLERWLAFY